MQSRFEIVLLAFGIFSTSSAWSTSCKNPFPDSPLLQFQGSSNCENTAKRIDLSILNHTESEFQNSEEGFYLKMRCVDDQKEAILLHNGGKYYTTVDNSEIIDGDPKVFKIRSACTDEVLATLNTHNRKIKVDGENDVHVSFTAYKGDSEEELIALVLEIENMKDLIVVRAEKGLTSAYMERRYIKGALCYPLWNVTNLGVDATILSFILIWKENEGFECAPIRPIIPSKWKASQIFGITIPSLVGACLLAGAGVSAYRYYYFERRLQYASINGDGSYL